MEGLRHDVELLDALEDEPVGVQAHVPHEWQEAVEHLRHAPTVRGGVDVGDPHPPRPVREVENLPGGRLPDDLAVIRKAALGDLHLLQ